MKSNTAVVAAASVKAVPKNLKTSNKPNSSKGYFGCIYQSVVTQCRSVVLLSKLSAWNWLAGFSADKIKIGQIGLPPTLFQLGKRPICRGYRHIYFQWVTAVSCILLLSLMLSRFEAHAFTSKLWPRWHWINGLIAGKFSLSTANLIFWTFCLIQLNAT